MTPRRLALPKVSPTLRQRFHCTREEIGRRGAVLMLLGLIYCLVGVGLVSASADPTTVRVYAFAALLFPLSFWAGAFLACGSLAIVSGFWPTGRDSWGFMCLTALATVWASCGFLTAILHDYPRGLLVGLSWSAIAGILMIVSGMRGGHDA